MEFIDLHIHLQDYKANFATDIVKKAQKSGLKKMVCAGTSSRDWEQVSQLSERNPELIIPAFGLHPWHVTKEQSDWEEKLHVFLTAYPKALIGETGLDGLKPDMEMQKKYFEQHIRMANEFHRPLIIHAVKAFAFFDSLWKALPEKFMFHSFNARTEQLQDILRRGGYVSFNASILRNRDCERIVKSVSADRLLFESDGPYQPRDKGGISSPFFISELISAFAAIRGENTEELAARVYQNSLEFINV
uniref:TatD family hydrolase n=1 Tax=uncultured Alphaproteobacteria bacterium TaxID=91750 RepID=A0A6G8F2S3_9PROT|nr:hypothetical protein PlAlph_5070 [uncultured Alphaproteobacteria bacterium]